MIQVLHYNSTLIYNTLKSSTQVLAEGQVKRRQSPGSKVNSPADDREGVAWFLALVSVFDHISDIEVSVRSDGFFEGNDWTVRLVLM